MASAAEQLQSAQDSTSCFERLENYAWDTDEEFKTGLTAILGPNPSPDQAAELTLRARCFYYSRKFSTNIDFDSYKAWKQQKSQSLNPLNGASASQEQTASASAFSYQDIVDMIQTGKPIPGIKDIPDTVLEGRGTESTKAKRQKPWEKDADVLPTEPTASSAS